MTCPSCHRRGDPIEITPLDQDTPLEVCGSCGFAGPVGSFSSVQSPPPRAERTTPATRSQADNWPWSPTFSAPTSDVAKSLSESLSVTPSMEDMIRRRAAREKALEGTSGAERLKIRAEWAAQMEEATPMQVRLTQQVFQEAEEDLAELLRELKD